MFEGGYNLTGFRVCVRRFPITVDLVPFGTFHLIQPRAILTRPALGPVR